MPRARINPPWTEKELEELRGLVAKGKSLAELAVRFRRRRSGIISKLRKLGLPAPYEMKKPKTPAAT